MYDGAGNLHYYLNDHLGSARVVIDSTGAVQDKYKQYYAFGAPEAQTVSTDQAYRSLLGRCGHLPPTKWRSHPIPLFAVLQVDCEVSCLQVNR